MLDTLVSEQGFTHALEKEIRILLPTRFYSMNVFKKIERSYLNIHLFFGAGEIRN